MGADRCSLSHFSNSFHTVSTAHLEEKWTDMDVCSLDGSEKIEQSTQRAQINVAMTVVICSECQAQGQG